MRSIVSASHLVILISSGWPHSASRISRRNGNSASIASYLNLFMDSLLAPPHLAVIGALIPTLISRYYHVCYLMSSGNIQGRAFRGVAPVAAQADGGRDAVHGYRGRHDARPAAAAGP